MPESINRRCPRCGRKAHDHLLVQCPDCRVPFVYEVQSQPELTPEQLQLLVRRILGSWKFWVALVILVGASAGAVVMVADRVIEARSRNYLDALAEKATNHIGTAFRQISNQITLEFKQPRIKAAIEQAAMQRAGELFTNGVQPSLDAFEDAINSVNAQLARSSNVVAKLESDALAAQQKVAAATATATAVANTPVPANPPAPAATTTTNRAATQAAATAPNSGIKLSLVNRTISPAGNNYILTLFFKNSGTASSGTVQIMAGTYKQTARILNFTSMTAGVVESPMINSTGDVAQLKFPVSDRETPTLILEVSAPTIVRIASDAMDNDLTIPIVAEKMQLPQAAK